MKLIILVICMALVTYLPRMLPLVLLQNIRLPKYLRVFMEYIPYAALGALIFPGVISSTNSIFTALLGCLAAVTLGMFEVNVVFIVLGTIAVAYLASYLPF